MTKKRGANINPPPIFKVNAVCFDGCRHKFVIIIIILIINVIFFV